MAVTFSPEVFNTVCERVAAGEALHIVCSDDDMPSRQSFYRWIRDDDDLCDSYVRAREEQADRVVDECIQIADDCTDPSKARVQIAARQWKASKMAPKKYGDKLDLNHSGKIKTISRIELVAPDMDDDATD